VPYEGNPILTQRDLAGNRAAPIANAGHADLVAAPDGTWWAVFLASRTYDGTHYNTGRETFLLPVTWKDGWPIILAKGNPIPYVVHGPANMKPGTQAPLSGNFTWRDDFDTPTLNPAWLSVRVRREPWADLRTMPGALTIHPRRETLEMLGNPSFLARRQQHTSFVATTALQLPRTGHVAAGLVAFQNENFWYFLGARRQSRGTELFLQRRNGLSTSTIATIALQSDDALKLRISANGRAHAFAYETKGSGWQTLRANEDGTLLSTDVAGGFVGAMVGPYAHDEQ
jgi:alpha-N-arabinofuranosidase